LEIFNILLIGVDAAIESMSSVAVSGLLALCFGDGFEVRTRVVRLSFVCSDGVPIFPEHARCVLAQNDNTKSPRAFNLDFSLYGKSFLSSIAGWIHFKS